MLRIFNLLLSDHEKRFSEKCAPLFFRAALLPSRFASKSTIAVLSKDLITERGYFSFIT